jgi:deoxyribodipyrimidine photo-lyase
LPVAERALFVFRRDLRLTDNRGLQAAAAAREVIPVFHEDTVLMLRWARADKRMAFLRQRLNDLDGQLKARNSQLHVTAADSPDALIALCRQQGIGAIYQNRDFTPYARRRDAALQSCCVDAGIEFHNIDDLTLNAPETVLKKDGTPYTVFTPYYNRAADEKVDAPEATSPKNFGLCEALAQKSVDDMFSGLSLDPAVVGADVVPALAERLRPLADYGEARDFPAQPGTSRLSAHIRFGTFSPRQVHLAVLEEHGTDHPLIRQLYWRDFYYQIAFHFPHVFTGPFRQQYRGIAWRSGEDALDRWYEGRTGFPIIDAGMRELVQTGYMHNRVRMVVASYLTKNLGYHWKKGEVFFSRHLVDFDPAVNNGNWQWASSTGCDAQPYFRVFNPWRQQKKFDPDVEYIQRWVPELRALTPRQIHGLEKDPAGYIGPQVDLKSSADAAKQRFRA